MMDAEKWKDTILAKSREYVEIGVSVASDLTEKGRTQARILSNQAKISKAQRQLGALVLQPGQGQRRKSAAGGQIHRHDRFDRAGEPPAESQADPRRGHRGGERGGGRRGRPGRRHGRPRPGRAEASSAGAPAGTDADAAGKKYCPQCGAEVAPDALFCTKCGAQL